MPTPRHRSRADGFTLIEIMVVVAIVGILATMVVQNVIPHADTAKEQRAAVDTKQIADAVRMFVLEQGRLPQLAELTAGTEKGKVYLERIPPDPWGGEYTLHEGDKPRAFEVRSAGPNRVAGDDDDVSSRPPAQ